MNINYPNTFTVTSQPFYDQYSQCYKNILTVNIEPKGPLNKFVRRLNYPRLSPFQRDGTCHSLDRCGLAITKFGVAPRLYNGCGKYNSGCDLMTPDDIPTLISFLLSNGYQVDTQITNMLNLSPVKINSIQKIAFTATYFGTNQPNIVYMR